MLDIRLKENEVLVRPMWSVEQVGWISFAVTKDGIEISKTQTNWIFLGRNVLVLDNFIKDRSKIK